MADAERILIGLLESVAKDEGIKEPQFVIKALSTGGANYTSTLHLITIKSLHHGMKVLELFAKVACVGEQIREAIPIDKIYATERFVYQELAKVYEDLQVRNQITATDKLKFPKFYACSDKRIEETVILENLTAKGYSCYDRLKAVSWEYAAAAVGELAKLHALSYAFAEDDPEGFAKAVAERAYEINGPETQMEDMFKKAEANGLEAVPENLKGRLKKFLSEKSGMENLKKYYTFPRRSVFVHGDYRASNIMHKRKNGKLESLIPLDYQTLHAGSPFVDLFYFIFTGTDGEFRKLHYKRLIQHYYDTFAGFLIKLGLEPETLYPKGQFDEDYRQYLPFGLIISMSALPVVLIESENAPTMQGDAKMSDLAIKPNEMFRKRFLEIVKDYVNWGVV